MQASYPLWPGASQSAIKLLSLLLPEEAVAVVSHASAEACRFQRVSFSSLQRVGLPVEFAKHIQSCQWTVQLRGFPHPSLADPVVELPHDILHVPYTLNAG